MIDYSGRGATDLTPAPRGALNDAADAVEETQRVSFDRALELLLGDACAALDPLKPVTAAPVLGAAAVVDGTVLDLYGLEPGVRDLDEAGFQLWLAFRHLEPTVGIAQLEPGVPGVREAFGIDANLDVVRMPCTPVCRPEGDDPILIETAVIEAPFAFDRVLALTLDVTFDGFGGEGDRRATYRLFLKEPLPGSPDRCTFDQVPGPAPGSSRIEGRCEAEVDGFDVKLQVPVTLPLLAGALGPDGAIQSPVACDLEAGVHRCQGKFPPAQQFAFELPADAQGKPVVVEVHGPKFGVPGKAYLIRSTEEFTFVSLQHDHSPGTFSYICGTIRGPAGAKVRIQLLQLETGQTATSPLSTIPDDGTLYFRSTIGQPGAYRVRVLDEANVRVLAEASHTVPPSPQGSQSCPPP